MAARRFTDADLERWVRDGIISADQRDAILREPEGHALAEGVELTALLYYGGGLLVLLAYSIFLGLQWQGMNEAARILVSAMSLAFFGAVSQLLLRSERFQLPGELLQVVAVAIVPLLAFAVLDAAGLWPNEPGYGATQAMREHYQSTLAWARIALATATLVVAGGAFAWSRSPFVLIAALVSLTAMLIDVTIQIQRPSEYYEWSTGQAVLIAAEGALVLAAGLASRDRTERDYTTWLYVAGLIGLAVGLSQKAFPAGAEPGWGALWMASAVAILGLSIPLQQRLFAVAGLAAVFAYFAKLVFDVFESANAALVLALLGLAVLGAGMLYQRYSERLFPTPTPPSSPRHV